jgi:hypothetical protein
VLAGGGWYGSVVVGSVGAWVEQGRYMAVFDPSTNSALSRQPECAEK